jgi:ATP-dependent DNA helicase RecQ
MIDQIQEDTVLRKCLTFLISFVYKEIGEKRRIGIFDMKRACKIGIEKGHLELRDYIDLYFNSKYARTGYHYENDNGKQINASLPDLTENGKLDDIKFVTFFMNVVDEDKNASQINNTKHLRGACARMLNNQPESYTLLLLNAFTLYMLEFKNSYFLTEAESLIQAAFTSLQEKEPVYSEKKLESIFYSFIEQIKEKNNELEAYMKRYGFTFDFETIMIHRLIMPMRNISKNLHTLNKILD